jgi:hypothetical protein
VQNDVLFFTTERGFTGALDEHVAIGENVDNTNGHLCDDLFGIVDRPTSIEGIAGIVFQGRQRAAFGEKPAGRGTIKEGGNRRIHRSLLARRRFIVFSGRSVFLDHDGNEVTDTRGPLVGVHREGGVVMPERLGTGEGALSDASDDTEADR